MSNQGHGKMAADYTSGWYQSKQSSLVQSRCSAYTFYWACVGEYMQLIEDLLAVCHGRDRIV